MGKDLQLQLGGRLVPDLPDLVQAKLPGQDDPLGPQLVPCPGGLVVDHTGLGGDVPLHMGGVGGGQSQGAHIGQDDGVHPQAVQIFQPLRQAGHLIVSGHGVAGNMDPDAPAVAELHRLLQCFRRKVAGKGAHAESSTGQIDRVCPIGGGHLKALHVAGRSQQFDLLSFHQDQPPIRAA